MSAGLKEDFVQAKWSIVKARSFNTDCTHCLWCLILQFSAQFMRIIQ